MGKGTNNSPDMCMPTSVVLEQLMDKHLGKGPHPVHR